MPAARFWFSGGAIYLAASFVFVIAVALIGIRDMISGNWFTVTLIIAAILSFLAWRTAAKQVEDSASQTDQISKLQQKSSSTDEAVRQIASAIGITNYTTPEQLAVRLRQTELSRRAHIMNNLRQQYVLSHDCISPELAAGMAWPPQEWINTELENINESWRVHIIGSRYEAYDVSIH